MQQQQLQSGREETGWVGICTALAFSTLASMRISFESSVFYMFTDLGLEIIVKPLVN